MTSTSASKRFLFTLPAVVLVALASLVSPVTLPTAAAGCNDVQVVFARGTDEPPGIGRVGQAFVNALRPKIGNRSMGVYAVNYPASYDFLAAADGANDASAFIQGVMNDCPNTRLVLGGYSQGAAIMDIITAVPFPAVGFNNPLPPNAPDHIAAIAVFGNPTAKVGLPLTTSPVYGGRSIDLCNAGDPICTSGDDVAAHRAYGGDGSASQAASFVADLL
ncbi:cutinase family protein [Mycolicibacterium sphagni]|uniref:Cutinase n=1 Tax=Mycolicibacterium sphagni TaxID=1786 RepID=A0ABX2JYY2_9MYCO|nr:cutinase family protein [Mycolicibacterium sphagni]